MERIEVEKYTVEYDETCGRLKALRHGEEWRDLCGDNLVYWMFVKIQEQEKELLKKERHIDKLNETLKEEIEYSKLIERQADDNDKTILEMFNTVVEKINGIDNFVREGR